MDGTTTATTTTDQDGLADAMHHMASTFEHLLIIAVVAAAISFAFVAFANFRRVRG